MMLDGIDDQGCADSDTDKKSIGDKLKPQGLKRKPSNRVAQTLRSVFRAPRFSRRTVRRPAALSANWNCLRFADLERGFLEGAARVK